MKAHRTISGFGWLPVVALVLTTGCGEDMTAPNLSVPEESERSPQSAVYRITIQGQADFTGLVGASWQLTADLVVTPGLGANRVDVGIFTHESPIVGRAGALYFVTNTSLSSLVGSNLGASAVDVASVDVSGNRMQITVNGDGSGLPRARLGTLNIYNLTSGVTAQVHHVLNGTIALQFSNDGQQVQGSIRLGGSSGFAGPNATSGYLAEFAGSRVQ